MSHHEKNEEKNDFHFTTKSSLLSFYSPTKFTMSEENLTAEYPNLQFGIFHNGNTGFQLASENIASMKISIIQTICYGIAGLIFGIFPFIGMISARYSDGKMSLLLTTLGVVFAFLGGNYFYTNFIKPKKQIENIKLSKDFLVYGILSVLSVFMLIIGLIMSERTFIPALLIGLIAVLFLAASSIKVSVLTKKGFSYSIPVSVFQYSNTKNFLQAYYGEKFAKEIITPKQPQFAQPTYHEQNAPIQQFPTQSNSQNAYPAYIPYNKIPGWTYITSLLTIVFYGLAIATPLTGEKNTSISDLNLDAIPNSEGIVVGILGIGIALIIFIILTWVKFANKKWVGIFGFIIAIPMLWFAFAPFGFMSMFIPSSYGRSLASMADSLIGFGPMSFVMLISVGLLIASSVRMLQTGPVMPFYPQMPYGVPPQGYNPYQQPTNNNLTKQNSSPNQNHQ